VPVKYWETIADNLSKAGWGSGKSQPWTLRGSMSFEIALAFVRRNHLACRIVNANHTIMLIG